MPRKIFVQRIQSSDPRLGRHVQHDSRSRQFEYPTQDLVIQNAVHNRNIPILDQGNIGSCTGNAGIGVLGTDPFLPPSLTPPPLYTLDEPGALRLYSDAEDIDGDGPFPPNDNGSDGLSIAKALLSAGVISGYQHTFSLSAALKALTQTPIMIGINWYESMFGPDQDGRLHISGQVAGGHELESREIDADNQCIWLDNSWGSGWGVSGRAYLTFTDFGQLLSEQGDVTVLLPLTVPPPIPTPLPPTDPSTALAAALRQNGWITNRHVGQTKRIATAAQAWLAAEGL